MELAYEYALKFSRPTVWVVCGMIASGKSTLARALADALQIRTLRSDVVRNELFDRRTFDSQDAEFGEGILHNLMVGILLPQSGRSQEAFLIAAKVCILIDEEFC